MPKGPGRPRRRSKPSPLRPLDVIYANEGVELPRVTTPEPLDIPLPYRSLLVHESDMTVTLEHLKLRVFEPSIRSRILRAEVPLGRILRDGGVDFRSQAKIFLAVTPNSEMLGVFWMREPRTLYGRQTDLIHNGTKIGDIVEILPPF
jgi:hypothetical protein